MEKEKFMKIKKKITILLVVILGIIIFFTWDTSPVIDKTQIKQISLIAYPEDFNYRQTINDCGPFNTATVVRALKGEEIDSQVFAEEIKWRLPNKYTLPWGLEKQLKDSGIKIETPNLKSLSDEDKILFLYEQLSQGNPIIILGERDDFEHYITIFGFDSAKDEFYTYDSLQDKNSDIEGLTIDDNGELPGNKTLNTEELLSFWRGGGMYGLYKWYVIVAST